ncbi:MAG: PAS domain-containing protein [Desulfobulbaceae bacterium]|nr:PAS domain-containing protein [Desulfobulbaceae bacterium]
MVLQQLTKQDLIDKIGVMVLGLDDQGRINLINAKGCEILGDPSEELIGVREFVAKPVDNKTLAEVVRKVLDARK